MDFKIDKGIEVSEINRPGRKVGTGTSDEYKVGTKIHEELEIGDSVFFDGSEVNQQALLLRLSRLNEQNKTDKEFTTRKEDKILIYETCGAEDKEKYFDKELLEIDSNEENDVLFKDSKLTIPGFRIHRIK